MRTSSIINYPVVLLISLAFFFYACEKPTSTIEVQSPNQTNHISFQLTEEGTPTYKVNHGEELVIDQSRMGFEFVGKDTLQSGFEIIEQVSSSFDEEWEMPWGEQRKVKNTYNELKISLQEKEGSKRKLNIYFRAYDDGVAFRYELLEQEGIKEVLISDELSEFQLTGDHKTWWIPGDWDIYEHLYNETKVSQINAIAKRNNSHVKNNTHIPYNAVNTPVTMRMESGTHLSFHEANLTDYSGMTLKVDTATLKLQSGLVGSKRNDYKVKRTLPFKTPWRTIQIGDDAGDLIESNLVVNLNEPNKLGDMSWFKPMKYVGIWWEMHMGKSSWDYGMTLDENGKWVDSGKAHGRHGATTENTKRYIDFAAENDISGVLVEGWNTGWERWIGFEDREGVFDFVTPYPDYDLKEITEYGASKGVEIIMHHETSAATETYTNQLDAAFDLMKQYNMHSVKTGYVGGILPKGEFHHGQYMVNHYRKVLTTAAKYNVAINAHEPIKATGLRRTYPNAIAREGLRGQEFNAWASDGGNPPEHLPTVAFTRMLAGPIDFTPGIFEINIPSKKNNQVNTTLAHQLGLYVVIYGPIQMAADLIENYENQPAFQFIRDVEVDWEQSMVLNGEVGDFVTIAREGKNTGNWFVGSISDENPREITIDFDFLQEGQVYNATLYRDADDANYKDNPKAVEIENFELKKGMSKTIKLAEGGGFALSILK